MVGDHVRIGEELGQLLEARFDLGQSFKHPPTLPSSQGRSGIVSQGTLSGATAQAQGGYAARATAGERLRACPFPPARRREAEVMPVPDNVEATVRALLDAAGLPVSDEEFDTFVSVYPTLREAADRLYLEEVRDEEPALIFTPLPPERGEDR